MAHYPPTRGDGKAQLERFVLTGITASYSFRGMLFGDLTATTVDLYRDVSRASGDKVATGTHAAPTSWTKVTLSQSNSSGISGSCWVKYSEADALWEVYPTFCTDTEIAVIQYDITRWLSARTNFYDIHKRVMEEFVRLMRQRIPPRYFEAHVPGAPSGLDRGDTYLPWRKNSVGDLELVGIHNLEDYRAWAEYKALDYIFRLGRTIPEDTQLQVMEDVEERANAAWAETIPQFDADQNMSADSEHKRWKISRG